MTVPSLRQRPAHCRSCSMLYGSPTTTTCFTESMSRPVAAQDVPTIILADLISCNFEGSSLDMYASQSDISICDIPLSYIRHEHLLLLLAVTNFLHKCELFESITIQTKHSPFIHSLYCFANIITQLHCGRNHQHFLFRCKLHGQLRSFLDCVRFFQVINELERKAFSEAAPSKNLSALH
jgi:hypothetical protein